MIHAVRKNLVRHVAGEEKYFYSRLRSMLSVKNIFLNMSNACVERGCRSSCLSEIKKKKNRNKKD